MAALTVAGQSTGSIRTAPARSWARAVSRPQRSAQATTSWTAWASSWVWKGTEVARYSVTGASTAPPRRRSLRRRALRAAACSRAWTTSARSAGRPERMWAVRPLVTPTLRRAAAGTWASTWSRTGRVTPRTESIGVACPLLARPERAVVRAAAAPIRRARACTSTTVAAGPEPSGTSWGACSRASSRATPSTPWEWPMAATGACSARLTPRSSRQARAACWARRMPGTETSAVSAPGVPAGSGQTGSAVSSRRRRPRGVMVSRSVATGASRAATAASVAHRAWARARSAETSSCRVWRHGVACPPKAST